MSGAASRRSALRVLAVALLALAGAPGVEAARPAQRPAVTGADVIYMVMVDRFANGDPSNDGDAVRADPRAFHGGDLAGVLQRLDYLAELGVSALWLSPLYPNPPRGYHGYWPLELRGIDPRFGDMATLRRLVDEAHARGIRVILDHVVNHTAPEHPWRRDPARRDWYHHQGDIRNWGDPAEVEHGDLFGLPDLNQENPEVAAYLLETARWWLSETGADGFRLDAAKHVPLGFWRRFVAEVRRARPDAFLLAEVFDPSPLRLRPYLEAGFDSAFDFALQDAITQTFAQGLGPLPVRSALALRERAVPDPARLAILIDSHDLPRFLYQAGFDRRPQEALARLRAALVFLMTVPGIPVLYYGTETGMTGGPDPYNRADMRFDGHPELRAWTAGLIRLRRAEPALHGREIELLPVPDAPRLLAYARYPGADAPRARPLVVAIQASSEPLMAARVPLPPGIAAGAARARLLYGTHAPATGSDPAARARIAGGGSGQAVLEVGTLEPWEARIYRLEPAGPLSGAAGARAAVGAAGLALASACAAALLRRSRRARRAEAP